MDAVEFLKELLEDDMSYINSDNDMILIDTSWIDKKKLQKRLDKLIKKIKKKDDK